MRNPSKTMIKRVAKGGGGVYRHHVGYMLWLMSKKKIDIRTGVGIKRYLPK